MDYEDFATRLNQLLKKHDRPASWLASQLGMSPSTVNRWLNEHTRPRSAEVVLQIAKILGINDPEEQIEFLKLAGYEYVDSGSFRDIGGDGEEIEQTNTQPITEAGHADVLAATSQTRTIAITVSISIAALLLVVVLYWNIDGVGTQDGGSYGSPTTLTAVSAGNDGGTKLPGVSISQTITTFPTATPLAPASTPSTTRTEPSSTVLPMEMQTQTATPTTPSDYSATATQETTIRETVIAFAISQTLVAITQTALSATTPTIAQTATSTELPTSTPTPTSSTIFSDNFSDNSHGWDLSGKARLSQGKLAISVGAGDWAWVTIPNIEVAEDFYLQAELDYVEGHCSSIVAGLAVGEENGAHHRFGIQTSCSGNRVAFYDNNSRIFDSPTDKLTDLRSPLIIGLESKNGAYSLFINGQFTESDAITPHGSNVGFFVWSPSYLTTTFTFDNVIVRDAR